MVKNILPVFALVALAAAVSIEAAGGVPKDKPDFIFLGSANKSAEGITSGSREGFNYWMSVNSASYEEAKRDCLSNTDFLLQIETLEEWDLVEGFLQDTDQTVSLVWVGGKYQAGTDSFVWESGQDVHNELWKAGEPRLKERNSRVAAVTLGQIVDLKTQPSTEPSRYICEGP